MASAEATPTKGARTQSRVLAAAIARFGAIGFEATSVPEVARSAGVTHTTVYRYFGSKQGLYDAALGHDLEALFDAADAALDDEVTSAGQIVNLLAELSGRLGDHVLAQRVLAEVDTSVATLRELAPILTIRERLLTRIRSAQAVGAVRDDVAAEELADSMFVVGLGLLSLLARSGASADRFPLVRPTLDTLATLLAPPGQARPRK